MTSSSFSSSLIPDILSFSSANSFYSSPFSVVRLLMKLLSHQSWDQSLRNYKNTLHSPSVPFCAQAAVISPLVSSFFAALASASHFRSALSLHPSHRLLLQLKYGEGSWFLSQTCVCSVLSGCSLDSSPSTHIADLVAWLPKSQVLFPITVLMFWECAKDLDCYQSFIWVAIKQHYSSLYVAPDTSCCGLLSGPQWRHSHFIHLFRSYHQLAPCPPLLVWGKKKVSFSFILQECSFYKSLLIKLTLRCSRELSEELVFASLVKDSCLCQEGIALLSLGNFGVHWLHLAFYI